MNHPTDENIERIIQVHGDRLFRMCAVMLGNADDAEDAVQETVIRYFQKAPQFENEEHEKAWLLRVASNWCRDMLRFRTRHPQKDIDSLYDLAAEKPGSDILDALMTLPEKFRLVMLLYYVEEYRIGEIAQIIRKTPSAVKMRLHKGRKLLGEIYRKEYL